MARRRPRRRTRCCAPSSSEARPGGAEAGAADDGAGAPAAAAAAPSARRRRARRRWRVRLSLRRGPRRRGGAGGGGRRRRGRRRRRQSRRDARRRAGGPTRDQTPSPSPGTSSMSRRRVGGGPVARGAGGDERRRRRRRWRPRWVCGASARAGAGGGRRGGRALARAAARWRRNGARRVLGARRAQGVLEEAAAVLGESRRLPPARPPGDKLLGYKGSAAARRARGLLRLTELVCAGSARRAAACSTRSPAARCAAVAGRLGLAYHGVDLSAAQVAKTARGGGDPAAAAAGKSWRLPSWTAADARELALDALPPRFDFVFCVTVRPRAVLRRPRDLEGADVRGVPRRVPRDRRRRRRQARARALRVLVVGEVRDADGFMHSLVADRSPRSPRRAGGCTTP